MGTLPLTACCDITAHASSYLQREALEALASRLASTLGVGKLSNVENEPMLERFMLKSIGFSFDQEGVSEENPGERLGFFTLAAKCVPTFNLSPVGNDPAPTALTLRPRF